MSLPLSNLHAAAQSLQVVTYDLPDPDVDPDRREAPVNSSISFFYRTTGNIRTLSTNGAAPGHHVTGLLYTPDLGPHSPCDNITARDLPVNVTRQANLPNEDYNLIAIAPWTTPQCVQQYFAAARDDPVRGFLWFLPGDNTSNTPPEVNSETWTLGDGGTWKTQNNYPVYAIDGVSAKALVAASADYSRNMTDVPYGHLLTEMYDPRDYVRLYLDIDTAGSSTTLPSLWVFLLVVLGILLGIIAATSFLMHWLQRRRRQRLRRRVENGEVDLEALGIKRLTVPQAVLDDMPLYTYGTRAPVEAPSTKEETRQTCPSRPGSPAPDARPVPAITASYRPTPLSQPTCAICLDDFVPASEGTEGTTVRELPCHHIFHPECVDIFLRDNSSLCPMCKKTALPKGYCPTHVTNAMVRRERMVRRIRERVTIDDDESPDAPPHTLTARLRARARTFSGLSHFGTGRRVVSAPLPSTASTSQPMSEMPPPPPAPLVRSNSDVRTAGQPRVQPPNTASRREWARQRAIAMLGRRAAPPDGEVEPEAGGGSRWRKVARGVFPGLRG
ncbi:Ring finger domain [Teratosphaeria destructans]|uniref:Ring finger domain n=1 Tax=Teratosphaeria destructans TaxID=418781 RepID=A0A9W7SPT3_9PEZI|nr:Ring finger domain [Teratosphaeria destructans]